MNAACLKGVLGTFGPASSSTASRQGSSNWTSNWCVLFRQEPDKDNSTCLMGELWQEGQGKMQTQVWPTKHGVSTATLDATC
jgi:hypothetical protein